MSKDFEKLYTENVKYTYRIIDEVFKNHSDKSLRDTCIANGTFKIFLDRLSLLTGEKKRTKLVIAADSSVTDLPRASVAVDPASKQKKENQTSSDKAKEKKGVGYTTGVGSVWNVQEYLESKDAKNSQIANIISIFMHSIKAKSDKSGEAVEAEGAAEADSVQMKDLILESSLLPILESAMRSGSLLEMAKET
jgi:hypothetical protein